MSELQDFILANPGGMVPLVLAKQIATADEVILFYLWDMSIGDDRNMDSYNMNCSTQFLGNEAEYANIQLYCLTYTKHGMCIDYTDRYCNDIFAEPCGEIEKLWSKIREMNLYGSKLQWILLGLGLVDPVLLEHVENAKQTGVPVKSARKV